MEENFINKINKLLEDKYKKIEKEYYESQLKDLYKKILEVELELKLKINEERNKNNYYSNKNFVRTIIIGIILYFIYIYNYILFYNFR